MNNQILTQEELKKQLQYDENTGLFSRFTAKQGARVGLVLGSGDGKGYLEIRVNWKKYKAHRLAWLYVYGEFPNCDLDHRDGNRSNNRIKNLRLCTEMENLKNSGVRSGNVSGVKGVNWHKSRGKWQARATVNYKTHYLGLFETLEEASAAYQAFAILNHGEFYRPPNMLS
jgi:hypothetical protein